jgi:hypothetical protein
MRLAFQWIWIVTGLAMLIVVGANVAVSLHTISTECSINRGGQR